MHAPDQRPRTHDGEAGYAMAVLLVSISVMSVMFSMAGPVWNHAAQREREAELIFRGEQYVRAIELFQRRYVGTFPPSIDVLIEERFLRRRYSDPMTEDGEFQILYLSDAGHGPATFPQQTGQLGQMGQTAVVGSAGAPQLGQAGPRGGIIGVVSKSAQQSIRVYRGRNRYNEWQFVLVAATQRPTAPAQPQPGSMPGETQPGELMPDGPVGPGVPPPGGQFLFERPGTTLSPGFP